jgi:ubiquitin carboxyl-terminal hydrolase 36/42
MYNMGNTCYLNSTLQALFHTPALYNYLMSGTHTKECKKRTSSCLICALTETLRDTMQSSVTTPNKVYEKLKGICKHMVHGSQEDAHEFLR